MYQYCNWLYRYTFHGKSISIRGYAIANTHWVFFGVSFPRNQNWYIFFKPCKVPIVSPFIDISCEGSFFFGQSSKRLSADRLRCEHRCFYMVTSIGLVLYILTDLGLHGKLLTKQTSCLMQPYAWFALRNFASLFSPATIMLASLHETHVYAQH